MWAILEHHIQEEEGSEPPALEQALSTSGNRGDSESLTKNFGRTKAFVPSRSHPSADNDLFRKFPDGIISPNRSKKYTRR